MSHPILITAAIEGDLDEAVIRRLLIHSQLVPGDIYGKIGKRHLHDKISGYNHAAQYFPWIVLADLDREAECAPPMRNNWLPSSSPFMCFRIAVHAVEAWLLADTESMAAFLGLNCNRIPMNPDSLPNPKEALINLARRSRRRYIREDIAPRAGSHRSVGPAYSSQLIGYVQSIWRPQDAVTKSQSLKRAVDAIGILGRLWSQHIQYNQR